FDINVQVSQHHDAAVCADVVFAPAKLPGGHVPLHDVDAVLLVEGDARHLVEAHHVVLAHQTTLPGGIVDEHFGNSGFAAGNEVRIRRNLLKQVALARAAWPQLHQVVVAFHERNHA